MRYPPPPPLPPSLPGYAWWSKLGLSGIVLALLWREPSRGPLAASNCPPSPWLSWKLLGSMWLSRGSLTVSYSHIHSDISHPFSHLFNHFLTHSLTDALTHSLTHPLTHSPAHSSSFNCPWPPVASRDLPWPPVASRGLRSPWLPPDRQRPIAAGRHPWLPVALAAVPLVVSSCRRHGGILLTIKKFGKV